MEALGVNAFANEIPMTGLPQAVSTNLIPVGTSSINLNDLNTASSSSSSIQGDGLQPPATVSKIEQESNGKTNRKWYTLGKRRKLSHNESLKRREHRFKQIVPKSSLQLIPEFYSRDEICDREVLSSDQSQPFQHELLLNGLKFVGQGRTKKAAKLNAYDQAFKRFFIEPNKETIKDFLVRGGAAVPVIQGDEKTNGTNQNQVDCQMEMESELVATPNIDMNGRYPALLSFAMHEYYTNYFAQEENKLTASSANIPTIGVPIDTAASLSSQKVTAAAPVQLTSIKQQAKGAKKLPDNAHLMNPIALVHIMRPDAKFIEMERDESGNFVMKLELDGKTFISAATNKKNSKLQCSQLACESLFNVVYPLATM